MFEEKPLRQKVINSKYPKKIKLLNKVSSHFFRDEIISNFVVNLLLNAESLAFSCDESSMLKSTLDSYL